MNKCEYKEGRLISCLDTEIFPKHDSWAYCPYCGADLHKPEPEAPTHEEIMTKWWFQGYTWFKVDGYNWGSKTPYIIPNGSWSEVVFVSKDWFTGRESAEIPPEVVK